MKNRISLTQKIMLSIIGVITLALILILCMSKTIVLKGFARFEEQAVLKNLTRAENSIEGELTDLTKICGDWAPWDDARDFVLGKDPNFVNSDLTENTITNLNINFIIFTDKSDKIYCIKEIDLEREKFIEPDSAIVESVLSNKSFFAMTEPDDSKSGFIILPDKIVMVAAHPISNSAVQKPISGTLIMGRYLNDKVLKRLSEKTQLNICISKNIPTGTGKDSVQVLSKNTIEGYLNICNLTGDDSAILKISMPRDIYNGGIKTVGTFMMAIVLSFVGILAALMFVIQRIVLHPINKLTEKYADIDLNHKSDTKLYTERQDEIGRLARSFNKLIEILKGKLIERRQAERTLVYAKKQAESANKAKGQFLANMSHEIRTPMNAIMGFCQILNDEKLSNEQREYVNIIHESSKHLLQVINDILDFSKIEAGKMNIEMSDFSIARLFGTVESMMRPAALEKGLKFEVRKSEDLPASIHSDPARLQQCLINLISNAIKFTKKGHVYVNVSLEQRNNKPFIRFDVEDTGIGISKENQKELFKSFTQIDDSNSRKYGGTGLGLSITKQLAELLGGQVVAKSEEGKGSTFSLVIPARIDLIKSTYQDGSIIEDIKVRKDQIEEIEFSGNLLIAEDVKTNQMLITSLLNRLGLEATIAQDGREAVEKAKSNKYDLIFMDIQMPNMDGYEAVKLLRKEGIKTPVIAMTAHAMMGDEQKCIEAGCDDYLPKPVDYRKLVEKISKYLSRKNQDSIGQTDPVVLNTEMLSEFHSIQTDPKFESEEQEIININQLVDRFGDISLIEEMLPTYLKDNRNHFEKLSNAIQNGDFKEVKFHAHAIKGAGRNLSVKKLSDLAANLETAGRNCDLEASVRIFNELKPEFEKVISFLAHPDCFRKTGNMSSNSK